MYDSPCAEMLVEQVQSTLERGTVARFEQKVAANALGIALRELAFGPSRAAAELNRLKALVGPDGDLVARNRRLAQAIRSGTVDPSDSRLTSHLISTAIDKLDVDQPTYPAFAAWKAAR